MRCQPGVHCGSARPEKRTEIAAPVRIRRERAREDAMTIAAERRRWPVEGLTRVPYWVYSDRDVYADEQARIFRGPTWHFLCLEAELPNPTNHCGPSPALLPAPVSADQNASRLAFEHR